MSQIKKFIEQLAAGDNVAAKETIDNELSAKAFESLDAFKKQIASTLFNNGDTNVEVQDTADSEVEEDDLLTQEEFDSLSEEDQQLYIESLEQIDELSKTTLRNYLKGSRQENQGGLGSAGHMSDKARSLGRTDQDKEDGRYEGAKRAKRKLSKEEVEQIDEVGDTPAGKKMLGSYLKKRTKQIPNIERNYQMTPYEDGPMGAKTIKKFQKKVNKGMGRAIDRLTK